MESALIIGASGGIGGAVAARLRAQGADVHGLSRSRGGPDLTDDAAVSRALGALCGDFDLVLVAAGGLGAGVGQPEKTIRAIRAATMTDQFALNAVGPALVMREAGRLLPRDRRAVFAVLSARLGSIGDNRLGGWISYRAAKAAVNQIVRTGAIELARTHPKAVCVALHPGTVDTELSRKYLDHHPSVAPAQAAANLLRVIGRLSPADTGGFFDWAGKPVPW